MEINTHRRRPFIVQPVSTDTQSAVQAIAPIKAVVNDNNYATSDLHAKLDAMQEVDSKTVDAAKAAIQAGKITLDSAAVARAILNFHRR
ncbi:flagellar biosynthesis anti-sigma factor FlgM [Yersinia similis]|uniref:flagellar biosynthesis anti-sigma factor FlgM n=1 Tax=Yersinia similis TaxID=367190 RepID=UPI0011A84056|nr:flagellar biosynthesis anti-sigma factor FlgM [Yersinia similis]